MKRQRKSYKTPTKGWSKQRIEREREILKSYGLRKKREIWKFETLLRKFRRLARELAAKIDKGKEKILVDKVVKLGLFDQGATLDDVLGLTLEKVLDRRLQTIIFKKGFANTLGQARQFIVHGHVKINDRRITYPSYIVLKEEEDKIKIQIQAVKKVSA
ncbi:MAG TPA: 30S ribosomal protein S4 [archaeon]|nr:30S ribosomal protein S4 [archaeon]